MKEQHFLCKRRYFWGSFTAAMVYAVSGSIWQALLAAVIFQIICLKVAD